MKDINEWYASKCDETNEWVAEPECKEGCSSQGSYGKTIAEAEIACLKAIFEKEAT